jgi:hypothetical protein
LVIGSSKASLPSSTSCATSDAVKALVSSRWRRSTRAYRLRVLDVGEAETAREDQPVVLHDRQRHARQVQRVAAEFDAVGERLELRRQLGRDVGERGDRRRDGRDGGGAGAEGEDPGQAAQGGFMARRRAKKGAESSARRPADGWT